jgi:hypothetical protein
MNNGALLGSPVATHPAAVTGIGTNDRTIHEALRRLETWIEEHNYEGYEPFDGLSSSLRPLTLGVELFERFLQQAVRQSPINLRPLVGVKPLPSTQGRGYMAAGYLKMYSFTGNSDYREKAMSMLRWLVEQKSPKFTEYSWANYFDYTSRGGHYPKGESTIVWTSLVGQVFLDAFEMLGEANYLEVADSVCRWILALPREETDTGCCINYHTLRQDSIHNASMLGAALLARTWRHTRRPEYLALSDAAMQYSCTRQLANGAWWYGEEPKYHWIDNFHTGYNLDCLKCYIENTGSEKYLQVLRRGFEYYAKTFFELSGRPRYYHNRAQPIDIQCASQSIETLTKFSADHGSALHMASRVAKWTIENMQDPSGYFYYRQYPLITAKAPMLHWGQATMYHALSLLLQRCGEVFV